jgi:hypothetical protein
MAYIIHTDASTTCSKTDCTTNAHGYAMGKGAGDWGAHYCEAHKPSDFRWQDIYCTTKYCTAHTTVDFVDLSNEADTDDVTGECDTCGDAYDVSSREGRCGDCGECSKHCTDLTADRLGELTTTQLVQLKDLADVKIAEMDERVRYHTTDPALYPQAKVFAGWRSNWQDIGTILKDTIQHRLAKGESA